MTRGATPASLVAGLLFVVLAGGGCPERTPPSPPGPEDAALGVFALAAVDEPTDEQIDGSFDATLDDEGRAALRDALEGLRPAIDPEVIGVEELAGLGRTVVDLAAGLPGGGTARYSVQLERPDDDTFRVRWFQGPGVEWPPLRRPRGEGLTTSPPPAD